MRILANEIFPCIILPRISEQSPAYIAKIITTAIESRTDWEGHFSVIEEQRIRMKSCEAD